MNPDELLVIDIETASEYSSFEEMGEEWKELWVEKISKTKEDVCVSDMYHLRAGVMAEFSKIICISIGYFHSLSEMKFKIESFYGYDEKKLLDTFLSFMIKISEIKCKWNFAGHNIKEFDIPFICRRLLINNLAIPAFLNFQNKKPWESTVLDTFQYWRFGDYKNFTSLKLLAKALNLPSPKIDIDGSMVGALYWEKNMANRRLNMIRIANYCSKDVETTMRIIFKLTGKDFSNKCSVEIVKSELIE